MSVVGLKRVIIVAAIVVGNDVVVIEVHEV